MKKEKCVPESKETPSYEAKHHSAKFLKKAASLASSPSHNKKAKGKAAKRKVATKKA